MRNLLMIGTMFLLTACASSTQPPVRVKGGDVDLMRVAGKWYGVYEGIDSGRKGTIHFELYRGTRVAEGKVIMNADKPELAKKLKIRFVSVGDDKIRGKIGPYEDPGCQCQVETEFVGRIGKDKIAGEFITDIVGKDITQKGRWSVIRKEQ